MRPILQSSLWPRAAAAVPKFQARNEFIYTARCNRYKLSCYTLLMASASLHPHQLLTLALAARLCGDSKSRSALGQQFRKRVHSGNVAWTSKDLLLIRISATYRATNEALRVGYNYGSMRHNFLKESMSQFFAKSRCTVESLSGRIVATTALRITLGLSTL